jgi:hypothetical protein
MRKLCRRGRAGGGARARGGGRGERRLADPGQARQPTLTIRGHRQPGLLEGGRLLREAGAILGVKLTTRG